MCWRSSQCIWAVTLQHLEHRMRKRAVTSEEIVELNNELFKVKLKVISQKKVKVTMVIFVNYFVKGSLEQI